MIDFLLILVVIHMDGGVRHYLASPAMCRQAEAMARRHLLTGERLFVYHPATGDRVYVRGWHCVPQHPPDGHGQGVPSS